MKTLIISDIHLTHEFDEKKFLFLEKLFSSYEKIILNGDFWDGYITTFDRFVSSRWNQLFPILKKRQTIYLYGNHDQKEFSDKRVSLFSIEQKDSHVFKYGSTTYHAEHGHVLCPSIDMTYSFPPKILYYINKAFQFGEHISTRLGSLHALVLKLANKTIKKKLKIKQFPYWYLCGHTHCAEFDKNNKFANSGFVQYGKASYLIVDSSGLSLRTQWYR